MSDSIFEEERNFKTKDEQPKEKPWALTLEWWEYLMLFIEALLVVYTLLVMIGLVPLPG